jgi:transposase
MTPGPHRRYSLEFKLRVVKAAEGRKGSLKSIAREFDISHSLVLYWLERHHQGGLTEEDNLLEKLRVSETHVAELERKIGQLTMEIDRLRLSPTAAGAKHLGPEETEAKAVSHQNEAPTK